MRHNHLHMQQLSSQHMEQYNALLRYVFQVTDHQLSDVGWQEKEIIRASSKSSSGSPMIRSMLMLSKPNSLAMWKRSFTSSTV